MKKIYVIEKRWCQYKYIISGFWTDGKEAQKALIRARRIEKNRPMPGTLDLKTIEKEPL
tara:strand:+ start:5611 stop:5787 length:177 start_codon:yes stop_codon:yes gene_type:complete